MHTEIRQAFQRVRKLPRGERAALIPMGNITVLAVDAAERTAGEKNGAGSVGSGDRRFFPQVRGNAGDKHFLAEAAEARLNRTVSTALTGTESTFHNIKQQPSFSIKTG